VVAIRGAYHGRQTRIGQCLPDLHGVIRYGGYDRNTAPGKHLVGGGVEIGCGVTEYASVRRSGQHTRRQPAHVAGYHHVQVHRIHGALIPGTMPVLEVAVEREQGWQEVLLDSLERRSLAGLTDERPVESVYRREDLGVGLAGHILLESVETRVDGVFVLLRKLLHQRDDPLEHIEQPGLVRESGMNCRNHA